MDTEDPNNPVEQENPSPQMEEQIDYKDKYFRLLAEMENLRKRLYKEKQDSNRFAVENILVEFLNPIDHLEKALSFTENASHDVKNWAMGFQMILAQLKEVLQNHNAQPFDSLDTLFDPHFHEAVETEETNEVQEGIILKEFLKGYKCGNRILRPARVKVAKHTNPVTESL